MTDRTELLARGWASLRTAIDECTGELAKLREQEQEYRRDLEALLTVGEATPAGSHGYVALVMPSTKGPARVIPAGLAEYDEQLTTLGLITEKVVKSKPGVRELRAAAAQLAAHGVPLSAVLMEPAPQPVLTLVPHSDGT